jgi:protein-disulfide isomerase
MTFSRNRLIAGLVLGAALISTPLIAQQQDAAPAQPAAAAAAESGPFDATQAAAIRKIVRDYLLAEPELLREVIAELNKRQETAAAERRKDALGSIYKTDTPFTSGKGKYTVVEFFDYNCGYCRHAFNEVVKLTDAEKDVRVVFIEFPILSDESRKTSAVAIAAAKQNKYWEFHRAMMTEGGPATEDKALKVAAKIGLNIDQLKKDTASPETEAVIEKNLALGNAMGIEGTPAFFVGDKSIPGAPEDLRQILTGAIQQVRTNGCTVC